MDIQHKHQDAPSADDMFVADRALFWNRFTGFAKWTVIAIVVLLVLMWLFLV